MSPVDRLRILVRVAELSSFTAAARSLGLPKATVSTAIKQLETEFGTQLLHRTTRRVHLTPDGQLAIERASAILSDLSDLSQMFQREGAPIRGRLRVDLPASIAAEVVLPELLPFMVQHPELELELGSTDRYVDVVGEGFDCVLRIGFLDDSSLVSRRIGAYQIVNCASRSYLDRYGTPKTLSCLRDHQLVFYSVRFGSQLGGFEYVDHETGKERSVSMRGRITVNSSGAFVGACRAGLGIIQCPEPGVRPLLESGELVEVLSDFRPLPLPVTLLYPHQRNVPRRVRIFMDWLAAVLPPRLA